MSEISYIEEIPEGAFLINLKFIQRHQWEEPSITDKYKDGTYHKGYFCGGGNIYLKLIMCKDNIVISSLLKSYVVHWYHTYILDTGMDRMEAMVRQHLYWPNIIDAFRKEVSNCDT